MMHHNISSAMGSNTWRGRHTPTARHGHPGQAHCTSFTLAKWAFRRMLVGSIRRDCVDHIIVLGSAGLRRILKSYAKYYNRVKTHRSLNRMRRFLAGSANRCDQFTRHPGRTSSPLRPCLSFRYTQPISPAG